MTTPLALGSFYLVLSGFTLLPIPGIAGGSAHAIWYTYPICYYLAQTGKMTNDFELVSNYIAGENGEIAG